MRKADFEMRYAKIADEVRSLRETEKYDNNGVRCWLIRYITSGNYSYTSAQLKKVFDLGFGDKKSPWRRQAIRDLKNKHIFIIG